MKNKILIKSVLLSGVILFSLNSLVFSQSVEDIFRRNGETIVWLGIDFTQVKLVGPLGTVDKEELIPLFEDMNRVIISERAKYNLETALRKDEVPYDLEVVTKLNSTIEPGKIISYSSSDEDGRLSEEAISVLIKQYKVAKPEGIGLVFFMETIDKTREKGTMWVTFFSLKDRNILLTEKISGTAGGIGFRNHWATTVYNVINKIRDTKFAEWRYRYVR
jgi:hypothetical protein